MLREKIFFLDYLDLYNELDEVVKRANDNNVKHLLTICTTLESFEKIKIITKKLTRRLHIHRFAYERGGRQWKYHGGPSHTPMVCR